MNFDLEKMQQSKNALRRDLAALPIAQKLALLDTLRQRALDARRAVKINGDSPPGNTPKTSR